MISNILSAPARAARMLFICCEIILMGRENCLVYWRNAAREPMVSTPAAPPRNKPEIPPGAVSPTLRIINAPKAAVAAKLKYERLPIMGIRILAKV